jgi:hypothetical protein
MTYFVWRGGELSGENETVIQVEVLLRDGVTLENRDSERCIKYPLYIKLKERDK